FKEWTGADGLTFTSGSKTTATATFTMPAEAVNVTATYEDIPVTTYVVTFNANGGSVTPASAETNAEGKLTTLPVPTRSGRYTFKGWYTAASGGNEITTSTVFNADTTIYAQWTSTSGGSSGGGGGGYVGTTYSIIVEDAENGGVNISRKSARKGDSITVTIDPDDGYTLKTLSVTDKDGKDVELTKVSGNKYTFKMPAGMVAITVTFECDGTTSNCSSAHLTDVDRSQWYHIAVDYVVSNGMMSGVGGGLFAPNASMERAMVIQVLYNLEGTPAVSYTGKFSDVAEGKWYTNAIEWGVANKLISGYGDVFKPEGKITREEIATILYNYAKFKGLDTSARGDLSAFSDGNTVSAWAKEFMQWAVGSGLMIGGGDVLNPTGNATRAEVAQLFKNFCEKIN
ncbi:MAG: hypothetical protein E7440_05365, partial [Ruminococcaceae bacterium]|nr:hypothetical protein [Oscillospiraceae bacterium]